MHAAPTSVPLQDGDINRYIMNCYTCYNYIDSYILCDLLYYSIRTNEVAGALPPTAPLANTHNQPIVYADDQSTDLPTASSPIQYAGIQHSTSPPAAPPPTEMKQARYEQYTNHTEVNSSLSINCLYPSNKPPTPLCQTGTQSSASRHFSAPQTSARKTCLHAENTVNKQSKPTKV